MQETYFFYPNQREERFLTWVFLTRTYGYSALFYFCPHDQYGKHQSSDFNF